VIWALVTLSFVLFVLGVPVFAAFGLSGSVICLWVLGLPPEVVGAKLWDFLDVFTMIATPLFICAGSLMLYGGSSRRLVNFFNAYVKHVPGGLAVVVVLGCAFFAAMCGSTVATAAAMGSILFPEMIKEGYDKPFSGGLIASAAPLGPIIPPSIWMILYGAITETSIPKLFLAGFVPGILIALLFIPYIMYIARRRKYGRVKVAPWSERILVTRKAIPALLTPILVLGGIYGGIFTPTEAACIAVIYALFIGRFVYRELTLKKTYESFLASAQATSNLFILIVGAMLFGFILYQLRIQDFLVDFVVARKFGSTAFLGAYLVLTLLLGMLIDGIVIMFLTVPLFLPVALALNIDKIFFGLILVISLCIGQISPPFGVSVFTVSAFTKEPSGPYFREALPFIAIYIVVAVILLFFPQIALWLPSLYG